jgi:hypothetical protein
MNDVLPKRRQLRILVVCPARRNHGVFAVEPFNPTKNLKQSWRVKLFNVVGNSADT